MFIAAGCTADGSDTRNNGYNLDSFRGGDVGLEFLFDERMPPERIKDNGIGTFSIMVVAQNQGEYDVPAESVHVALTGFDLAGLNVQDSSQTISAQINGFKKQGTREIPGGRQQVTFTNLKYLESLVSGTYDLDVTANVCYPYQTTSRIVSCVSGNTILGFDDEYENCEIDNENVDFANSGGPVHIENVRQYSNGESSIQIQFDIVHKSPTDGFGRVYSSGSVDNECNIVGNSPESVEAISQRDKVTYTVETGITGLDCEGTGTASNEVTLSGDSYTVTCIQDTAGQGDAYEKLATITLDYDYLDRVSKTVIVEHVQK